MLDVVFAGARVVDGTGSPWFRGDVGVADGRIVEIGRITESCRRRIDATGLVLCPGFIDMHAHSDTQLLVNPAHEAKVHQGVTVDVIGQDGLSYAPVTDEVLDVLRPQLAAWNGDPPGLRWDWRTVEEYLARFEQGIAVNVAYLIPHGTVRMVAMGNEDRPPTDAERVAMKQLIADGLAHGAVGLSAGLTYVPGMYADDDELVELCSVLRGTGGFYCPHHRNYGMRALEGYRDSIEIARRASVPLHLAHAHLGYPVNRGRAPELLAMIDEARSAGVDVTLDSYPYLAACTSLHAVLPGWAQAGGTTATLDRLQDPQLREQIRGELEETGSDGHHGVPVDWAAVRISGVSSPGNESRVGRTIAEIAGAESERPFDVFCDLVVTDGLATVALLDIGNEDNVREIMRHPCHTGGSDGMLVGDRPHPRGWGTFPRYLGRYVRELGVLGLEDAVRQLTSLPARRLNLWDRGVIRPGMVADIVCFDADTIADTATYEEPRRQPEGIPYVAVGGRLVVDGGRHTGELPGRVLRGPAARSTSLARS
jgi:N-acyl-D-amino-acid deacylase